MGKLLAACVIACLSSVAWSGPLTYDVSRIIAGPVMFTSSEPSPAYPIVTADYRITGTITTDGTLGSLSATNILDWVLDVTLDSRSSYLWTGPLSGGSSTVQFAAVSAVTASSAALTFDPALSPMASAGTAGLSFGLGERAPRWYLFGPYESLAFGFGRTGPVVTHPASYAFATIAAEVPEPVPLSLVGAGLLAGLVGRSRVARRRGTPRGRPVNADDRRASRPRSARGETLPLRSVVEAG